MKIAKRAGLLLVIMITGLVLMNQALFAQQPSAFQQGVAASQAGNHEQALIHFQRARNEGNESLSLTYNLGVTHFQLGQYGQAAEHFQALVGEPRWSDLARYNLGLVAKRQGRTREANRHFEEVARLAYDDRLRDLALLELEPPAPEPVRPDRPPRPDRAGAVLLSVAAGFDDNVIAFPDRLQEDGSGFEDTFVDLLAYGQTYLSGRRDDGIRLFGLGTTRRHFDLDFFDTTVVSAGLVREQPLRAWTLEYGAALDYSAIDGDAVTTDAQLRLGASHRFGAGRVRIVYQPTLHSAGSDFAELDGTSHRIDTTFRSIGPLRFTASYRFEYNDRDDLETEDEFFSYSPIRHRIQAGIDNRVGATSFGMGLIHQISRYRGANRMIDIDGEFREERRESNRTDFYLRAGYEFARNWQATGEFRHTRQTDTFEFFEYDRNVVMLGVEFVR